MMRPIGGAINLYVALIGSDIMWVWDRISLSYFLVAMIFRDLQVGWGTAFMKPSYIYWPQHPSYSIVRSLEIQVPVWLL